MKKTKSELGLVDYLFANYNREQKTGERIGYISGLYFANQLRLTTLNPVNLEVVTNNLKEEEKVIEYDKRKITLRKSRIEINDSNYKVLQVLDLLRDFKSLSTKPLEFALDTLSGYLADVTLSEEEFDRCCSLYYEEAQQLNKDQ